MQGPANHATLCEEMVEGRQLNIGTEPKNRSERVARKAHFIFEFLRWAKNIGLFSPDDLNRMRKEELDLHQHSQYPFTEKELLRINRGIDHLLNAIPEVS